MELGHSIHTKLRSGQSEDLFYRDVERRDTLVEYIKHRYRKLLGLTKPKKTTNKWFSDIEE